MFNTRAENSASIRSPHHKLLVIQLISITRAENSASIRSPSSQTLGISNIATDAVRLLNVDRALINGVAHEWNA